MWSCKHQHLRDLNECSQYEAKAEPKSQQMGGTLSSSSCIDWLLLLLSLQHICHPNGRLHANSFLCQEINQERVRSTVTLGLKGGLALLVLEHVLQIHVKEVGRIQWPTFRFRMELR